MERTKTETGTVVFDTAGRRIAVGSLVRDWEWRGKVFVDLGFAIVTRITEPDGDVDEDGRNYGIAPRVVVQYSDCEDEFACTQRWWGNDEWVCDEIDVEVIGTAPCPFCGGDGEVDHPRYDQLVRCPTCDGRDRPPKQEEK